MLSSANGRLCSANKVGLFRAENLARYVLQCAKDSCSCNGQNVSSGHFIDITPLWDQRDKNCSNRDLKTKLWDEVGEK
jgi:hypothetical protein